MRYAVLGYLLLCTACGPGEAPPRTVQDSAGIQIVENIRPVWRDGQEWQVSQNPVLSLGTLDGDRALAFDRLSGAYIVGADRIAVLDEGAGEIRFFSLDGSAVSTFGRSGQGPGEFQGLTYVDVQGDSLWVFDGRQRRITVLDLAASGFRVVSLGVENASLGLVGLLPNGSMIVAADLAFSSAISDDLSPGLQRFGAAYVRVTESGVLQDTVLVTDGSERILMYGRETVQMLRPLGAHSVSHAMRGDELLHGTQDTYQIGIYAVDGVLRGLIRRPGVDLGIDEAAYREAVEGRVLAAPEPARPGLRSLYADQPRPESRPAYSRFLVDSDGLLWVQDFSYSGEARSWAVFDGDGSWLGMVELPPGFHATQILDDRVVGVWRDDLDVEYARIYELTRGGGM